MPKTSILLSEFLIFQQGLTVTGHSVQIFIAVQDYIAVVVGNTGGLKIGSSQSPSLTMKESVFRNINWRITIDAIWSYHLSHFKQILTKVTVSR